MKPRATRDDLLRLVAPDLEPLLLGEAGMSAPRFGDAEIRIETVQVPMRDGALLATDLHLPPTLPAAAVLIRTPYGREREKLAAALRLFARHGHVVVAQDCRGTGDSEPELWDYYVREKEDSYDLVDWVSRQPWHEGGITSCGGSYAGQTQWAMALHPAMSAIAPEVSGLGVAVNTADLHMFLNAYARTVGKGADKLAMSYGELEHVMLRETLDSGLYDAPLASELPGALLARYPELHGLSPGDARAELWRLYTQLDGAGRAEFVKEALDSDEITISEVEALKSVFGQGVAHDAHSVPYGSPRELAWALHASPLLITGWYDWGLNDALATWALLQRDAKPALRRAARLIVAPSSHNGPGYHEDADRHPELARSFRTESIAPLLLNWFAAATEDRLHDWPPVIYYLMGANEWRTAQSWPPSDTRPIDLFFGPDGRLFLDTPARSPGRDSYRYDPFDPTPTVGGSILSTVYPPGSVDVSAVQQRSDVRCYTSEPLEHDLDLVGPLEAILHASSSAPDTDFAVRLSDVLPDGRAIQIQNGLLRARHRGEEPEALEPGRIYQLRVDMWATAHRFRAGHRIRIDVSSADFPRFNRNSNGAGRQPTRVATQILHFGAGTPSRVRALCRGLRRPAKR